MQDQELFNLCKAVYEKTGWDATEKCYAYLENPYVDVWGWEIIPCHEDNIDGVDEWHPLYTSDYILEKLPRSAVTRIDSSDFENPEYVADSFLLRDRHRKPKQYQSSTPLKALLKLTIALHKAGQLNNITKEVR